MHAYVLGLENHWRGDTTVMQAERLGFDTEVVWGIDGRTAFTGDGLKEIYDDELARIVMGRPLSTREIAVVIGHRKMYERFLATGDEWALFMEDDGVLTSGVAEVPDNLRSLGKHPTVVTVRVHDVGHNLRWPARRRGMLARLIEPPFGTSCYFMNRRAAEIALAVYQHHRIDSIPDFPMRWKFRVRFWMSLEDLSPHTYEGSTLAEDRTTAEQIGHEHRPVALLRRLRRIARLMAAGFTVRDLFPMLLTQPALVKAMAGLSKLGMPNTRITG